MKCNICPLFNCAHSEAGESESCILFGDAWDSPFQYEDKHGTIVGCYIEKAYINKVCGQIYKNCKAMAAAYFLEKEERQQESWSKECILGE